MPVAVQDLMAGVCFGCGAKNELGLQIKSYWDGKSAVCRWKPKPHHTAGPEMLYGGVIASLLDCHTAVAAVCTAYEAEGREIGSDPKIYYVTANLSIDYLSPSPISSEVELTATVTSMEGRKARVVGSLVSDGVERARCNALFIRIHNTTNPTV